MQLCLRLVLVLLQAGPPSTSILEAHALSHPYQGPRAHSFHLHARDDQESLYAQAQPSGITHATKNMHATPNAIAANYKMEYKGQRSLSSVVDDSGVPAYEWEERGRRKRPVPRAAPASRSCFLEGV